jgi:hypothetical protein
MNWYEFTFDVDHPQDSSICLRMIVEIPVPPARKLPKGSMLESRIRFRGDRHD